MSPRAMSAFARSLQSYRNGAGVSRGELDRDAMASHVRRSFARVASDPAHGLMRHQNEALEAIVAHLGRDAARRVATCIMPTASGKTRVFLSGVSALGYTGPDGRTTFPNVIVLVPTQTLISQVLADFAALYPHVDVGYLSSATMLDAEGRPIRPGVRPVTVMTYQGYEILWSKGSIRSGDVDVMVMDEAHRGLSDLRRDALGPVADSGAVLLPMTATPAFSEKKSIQAFLGQDAVAIYVDPQRLRNEGVIAPVANYVVGVHIEGDFPKDSELALLMRRKALVDAAIDVIEDHVDEVTGIALADKVAIFYGSDIAHARLFTDEYNRRLAGRARRMVLLTHQDGQHAIREAIRAVRSGEVTGLANAQMLVEGFDLPKVGLVINSPTESLVRQLQQSGRAQRIDRALAAHDPEQTAFVMDMYYRVGGEILGKPVFYFDAVHDPSLAKLIEPLEAVNVGDIDVSAYVGREDFLPEDSHDVTVEDVGEESEAIEIQAVAPNVVVDQDTTVGVPVTSDGVEAPPSAQVDVPANSSEPEAPRGSAGDGSGRGREYSTISGAAHIDSIVRFARERDGPEIAVEPIEGDWMGRVALAALLRTSVQGRRFIDFFEGLEAEAEALREASGAGVSDTVLPVRGGVPLRMSYRRAGILSVWTYDGTQADAYAAALGLATQQRDETWKTRQDMTEGRFASREHREYLNGLEEEFLSKLADDPACPGVTRKGRVIRMARRSIGDSRRLVTHTFYHSDDVDTVRRLAGMAPELQPKTSEWHNRKEMEAFLGGRGPATDALFRAIEADMQARERFDLPDGPILRFGKALKAEYRLNGKARVACYHDDDKETILAILGRAPRAAEGDWLMRRELAAIAKVNPGTHRGFQSLSERIERAARDCGVLETSFGKIRCSIRSKQSPKPVVTVHANDVHIWRAELKRETFDPDSPVWEGPEAIRERLATEGLDAEEAMSALMEYALVKGRAGNEGAPFGDEPRVVRMRSRVFVHVEDVDQIVDIVSSSLAPSLSMG